MPLLYIKTSRNSTVAVWKTTEDLNLLKQGINVTDAVEVTLSTCKAHRKTEIIGTRHLLNYILAEQVTIIKDENGRPIIEDYPTLSVSISHSGEYSAVMISESKRIGVDIQLRRDNIKKLAPKFLFANEVEASDRDQLHYYWGIKESVFKAWSKGGVDFKSMISVSPFHRSDQGIRTRVVFNNGKNKHQYQAQGQLLDNLYLTFVIPLDE